MNTSVKVDGMQVRTKVNSNLLVSADTTESHFGIQLSQAKSALVEPVSTVDGDAFFYTANNNVAGNGDALSDTYVAYNPANTSAFNTNYGTTGGVGYVDYTLYLKATSTINDSKVALTKCNLLYNNTAVGEKAWRVAIFANQSADNPASAVAAAVSTTLAAPKSILALSGAANFNNDPVKAVASTSALGNVTYGTAAVIDGDIDAGTTRYYYIVARLWLEGEDTTCTAETFKTLNNNYTLDLDFAIGTDVSAVTIIGTTPDAYAYATVDSTAAGVTLTDGKLSNGATPSTYVWHKVSDDSVVAGATTDAAPAKVAQAENYYCIITAEDGNIYRTGTVAVAAL